jgi:hypothetical protein
MRSLTAYIITFSVFLMLLGSGCQTSVVNSVASGTVLFQDDFSNTSSGWMHGEDNNGNIADYYKGGFRIFVNTDIESYISIPHLQFTNTRIEVDASKIAGPDDNDFGIICRFQDENNFYFFEISSDGYYGIGKYINNQLTLLNNTKMQASEIIHQGNASNHLRADCDQSNLVFYVNGQKLAQISDNDFKSGDVGLIAGTFKTSGTDILFDNFTVMKP